MVYDLSNPRAWRKRALELRKHARQIKSEDAKRLLLLIASDYERTARHHARVTAAAKPKPALGTVDGAPR